MNCIIIDDEPLAREAMEMLVQENKELCLLGMFNNAVSATQFMDCLLYTSPSPRD